MRTPYLIQRAEIHQPLKEASARLSEAVNFDYMGSAEFEFGALPKSLRALQAQASAMAVAVVTSIVSGEKALLVLHAMSPEDFAQYERHLHALRTNSLRTKESTRFGADEKPSKYWKTDFWWDIDNQVMWSFDEAFMERLPQYLASSWKYMDAAKAST